jgi:hypothetical protein
MYKHTFWERWSLGGILAYACSFVHSMKSYKKYLIAFMYYILELYFLVVLLLHTAIRLSISIYNQRFTGGAVPLPNVTFGCG